MEAVIAHSTFFARRTVFEHLDGYLDQTWTEGYNFLLRAWEHGLGFAKVARILVDKRDSQQRLHRTDPRCKRPAMLSTKAHYFSHGRWLDGRNLIIAGAGPSARTVIRAGAPLCVLSRSRPRLSPYWSLPASKCV